MNTLTLASPLRRLLVGAAYLATAGGFLTLAANATPASQDTGDVATVRRAFDTWAARSGGPFDLLRGDARWTIVGRSVVAGSYATREAFMRDVIRPFNARMREPLKPTVREVFSDRGWVIVLFDARSVARDGVPYENTYTWYLRMQDGRIAEAIAFFDSIAFDQMWNRVQPAP